MQSAEKYTSLFNWLTQCVCPRFVSLAPASKKKLQSSRFKRLVPVLASRVPERAGFTWL